MGECLFKRASSLDNLILTKVSDTTLQASVEDLPAATGDYQWYRDGVAISGATTNTYTAQADDSGKEIVCKFTGTGSYAYLETLESDIKSVKTMYSGTYYVVVEEYNTDSNITVSGNSSSPTLTVTFNLINAHLPCTVAKISYFDCDTCNSSYGNYHQAETRWYSGSTLLWTRASTTAIEGMRGWTSAEYNWTVTDTFTCVCINNQSKIYGPNDSANSCKVRFSYHDHRTAGWQDTNVAPESGTWETGNPIEGYFFI